MIPKVVHYCWFGGNPLPPAAVKCIESWKKFLPDYEIKEWNESNFDVNILPYTADAYKAKKYAFVSDYARMYILYKYGGVYFDTDVEVIKSLDEILERGSFMGIECFGVDGKMMVNPGLGLAASAGDEIFKDVLDIYSDLSFFNADNTINMFAIVRITSSVLSKYGLRDLNEIQQINGITIYPAEYFNPMNSINGVVTITENTRTIHWFANSWGSRGSKLLMPVKRFIRRLFLR